ncbi:hypothetical protein HanIR_Chr10g0485721 [Helianthus annuus]|nr:hypothetical protein HanIR_Chr10g0485721 [Helianthus annuus]
MSAEHVIGFGSLRSISPQMPCNLIKKSSRAEPFCLSSFALTCKSKVCSLSFPLLYVTTNASHNAFAVGNSVRLPANPGLMFCMSHENTTRSSCSHCSYCSSDGFGGAGFPVIWLNRFLDFPQ